MAQKKDETFAEDVGHEISDTKRNLVQTNRLFSEIGRAEEQAEEETRKNLRYIDSIQNFWQGPEANRYLNEAAGECRESLQRTCQAFDAARGDLQVELKRLQRRQESLQAELNRIENKSEEKTPDA